MNHDFMVTGNPSEEEIDQAMDMGIRTAEHVLFYLWLCGVTGAFTEEYKISVRVTI